LIHIAKMKGLTLVQIGIYVNIKFGWIFVLELSGCCW
jgi:hypothetical protein